MMLNKLIATIFFVGLMAGQPAHVSAANSAPTNRAPRAMATPSRSTAQVPAHLQRKAKKPVASSAPTVSNAATAAASAATSATSRLGTGTSSSSSSSSSTALDTIMGSSSDSATTTSPSSQAPHTPRQKRHEKSSKKTSPITKKDAKTPFHTPSRNRVGNRQFKTILRRALGPRPVSRKLNFEAAKDDDDTMQHDNRIVSSTYALERLSDYLFTNNFSGLNLNDITPNEKSFLCRNLLTQAFVTAVDKNIFSEKRPQNKRDAGITKDFETTYITVTSAPQKWLKNMLMAAYDVPQEHRALAKRLLTYFCAQLCRETGYTPTDNEQSTWMNSAYNDNQYQLKLIQAFEECGLAHLIRTSEEQTIPNFTAIISDIVTIVNNEEFDKLKALYTRLNTAMPAPSLQGLRAAVCKCLQTLYKRNADCIDWAKRGTPFAEQSLCRRGLEELYTTLSPILTGMDEKKESKSSSSSSSASSSSDTSCIAPVCFCDGHSLRILLSKSPFANKPVDFNGGHCLTRNVSVGDKETKFPVTKTSAPPRPSPSGSSARCAVGFQHSSFEFVSDFELRISDFSHVMLVAGTTDRGLTSEMREPR